MEFKHVTPRKDSNMQDYRRSLNEAKFADSDSIEIDFEGDNRQFPPIRMSKAHVWSHEAALSIKTAFAVSATDKSENSAKFASFPFTGHEHQNLVGMLRILYYRASH